MPLLAHRPARLSAPPRGARRGLLRALTLAGGTILAGPLLAQEAAAPQTQAPAVPVAGSVVPQEAGRLLLELNTATQVAEACRLTVMAHNDLGADLSRLLLEAVILDQTGIVAHFILLDFQELPEARPRVRQFDLPATDCGTLGGVLINQATACESEGLAPAACMAGLTLRSRIADVEFLG